MFILDKLCNISTVYSYYFYVLNDFIKKLIAFTIFLLLLHR